MGFEPPPNAPSLPEQAAVSADLSFPPAPSGASLCGFALPSFSFDFPPVLFFALPLNCDLADPFPDVPGGGRKPNPPPPDPEFGI